MKYILAILCLVSMTYVKAQTVEKFYDYKWDPCRKDKATYYSVVKRTDSGFVRNDFFVRERTLQMSGKYRDPDCIVANGFFRYFYPNQSLKEQGNFADGKKDGLWLGYHNNGRIKDSTNYKWGNITGKNLSWHTNGYISDSIIVNENGGGAEVSWFENGGISHAGLYAAGWKKAGRWKYYHSNGKLSAVEIYDNGKCINRAYATEAGEVLQDTTNRDKAAEFPGGNSGWKRYLKKSVYFPSQYKIINSDQAVVIVTFAVGDNGNVSDAYVSTSFVPQFDKIALDAVLRSPKWTPAIDHNRKVKTWRSEVFAFQQWEVGTK